MLDGEHLAVVQRRAVVPVEVPKTFRLRLLEAWARRTVVEDPRHAVEAVYLGLLTAPSRVAFGPVAFDRKLRLGR